MKKEYLILIVLITGLAAYLALKKDDQIHYQLPVLPALEAEAIDRIVITREEGAVTLSRNQETWTIGTEQFPADASAVNSVMDTVKGLALSALVSEAGDKVRYELDAPNAIEVRAYAGETEKRRFFIGKTAPSFNHTFVMLGDGSEIFQADKSFRNDFDKGVDDFRDKLVLSFDTGEIKKITLEKQGVIRSLALNSAHREAEENDQADTDAAPAPVWQFEDGTPADVSAAKDLLSSLSHLESQGLLKDDQADALKKETPVCKISLENGDTLGLHLFDADGEEMAGQSTSSPYAFTLAAYKTEDILSYVNKLLGLEQKEEPAPEKE
ncbi:MAG: DUF4340 domain-containing protein [Desulfobacter sp.]